MQPGRRFSRTWLKHLLMLTFIYSTLSMVVDTNVILRIFHHVVVTVLLGMSLVQMVRWHRSFPATPLN